ncbi:MAG: response regulator transcription factor [Acidobacteria bacterium]|nr:response regulator transcription factor [Acidobacteriota bacterium]
MAIRIVLADDHSIVLHGLQQMFERLPDFQVIACCAGGAAAIEAVKAERPDVLVLDLRMQDQSGLAVLRALAIGGHTCPTVLLTAAITDAEVVEAMRLGARGLVLKESQPDALIDCVRRVASGEQWIQRETVTKALQSVLDREAALREAGAALTPRELDIVRMIAQGLRNRAIAERLSISEGTVKVHLHNIYDKLGVNGRVELVLRAQERGLT